MFKKYNWKQPIYKDDLINVLINGFLCAILGGLLAGCIDFLFGLISFPISFGLVIICYMIGLRMRKAYMSYHILYPTLSILFMIIALIFSRFAQYLCIFQSFSVFKALISLDFYLSILMAPVYNIILYIKNFEIYNLIIGIINIIIYIYAFVFCFRMVKGRN